MQRRAYSSQNSTAVAVAAQGTQRNQGTLAAQGMVALPHGPAGVVGKVGRRPHAASTRHASANAPGRILRHRVAETNALARRWRRRKGLPFQLLRRPVFRSWEYGVQYGGSEVRNWHSIGYKATGTAAPFSLTRGVAATFNRDIFTDDVTKAGTYRMTYTMDVAERPTPSPVRRSVDARIPTTSTRPHCKPCQLSRPGRADNQTTPLTEAVSLDALGMDAQRPRTR